MAEYNQLSDGRPDGAMVGQSASDKVGFFGTTPVAQQANVADATDAATAITKLNAVIAALEAYGLLASS
jgi:hypothetical protein